MSLMNSRVRKFFSYYKPYLGLFSADMACAVIASAAMLAIPFTKGQYEKSLKTIAEPKPHPMVVLKFSSKGRQ